ncbi:MAG: hypothetical protein ACXADO_01955 [Candidatus Thorarchaeota archaeon]|jgi:hypothetical protein
MSFSISPPPRDRIGIPEAMTRVIDLLLKGQVMSISAISRATKLDRRTVDKVLDMIFNVQESLRGKEVLRDRLGNSYVVRLRQLTSDMGERISSARTRARAKIRRRDK